MITSGPPRASLTRLAIPAAVVFGAAVLLGWNAGDTVVPKASPAAPIRWSLPRPRLDDTARDLSVVTAGRPWNRGDGTPGSAAPRAAAAPVWRLAGVVERGRDTFALIATGAGPSARVDYLRIGDKLPDGSVLTAVTRDSVTAAGGKTGATPARIYRLFGSDNIPAAAGAPRAFPTAGGLPSGLPASVYQLLGRKP